MSELPASLQQKVEAARAATAKRKPLPSKPALERDAYKKNRIGWVFYLMFKYLRAERFKPVIEAMKAAANDEERGAARTAFEAHQRGEI